MKRILTLTLAAAAALSLLAGCGSNGDASTAKTPEELTTLYAEAITANGGEMVEYNPVISQASEEDGSAMLLETMGLKSEDMTAFGVSMSMMNVKAYAIAAVMPAADKAEAVMEALQTFVENQKQSFEMYLADQFEVASNARLETLSDGTILLVMAEGQDEIFTAIKTAIEG